jgi:tetratricopeptide (TPR) repeat protein
MSEAEQTTYKKAREEVLPSLFDRTNIALLCLLKTTPSYPRKLAKLLGARESHISERLTKLKRAGLLFDRWERVETDEGLKNVKQYYLNAHNIVLEFNPEGVEIKVGVRDRKSIDVTLPYYRSEIPKSNGFVGRRRELEVLRNCEGTTVVWGMPGIGKTTLVSQFAMSTMAEMPVFWHQLSQVDSFQYFVTKVAVFLNTLGDRELLNLISQGFNEERILAELTAKRLSLNKTLIVLDDFHKCKDESIIRFIEFIAEKGSPRCIIISRSKTQISNLKSMKIEGLSEEECRLLINNDRSEEYSGFIKKCGGHPLLIKMVSELRNANLVDVSNTINDFIRESILASLDEENLSILLSVSVFRGLIDRSAIKSVARGISEGSLLNFIITMERIGVLKFIGDDFQVHPLVREAAYNFVASKKELHEMAGKYYAAKVNTKDKIEALYHFVKGENADEAIGLLKNQEYYVDEGYGNVLLNMLQELSPIKDERLSSWALIAQANAIRSLQGDLKTAEEYYKQALRCAIAAHDNLARASALSGLGIVSKELGNIKLAQEYYDKALKTEGIDRSLEARIMYNAAEAYLEEGRLEEAYSLMMKSMNADKKLHNIRGYFVSRLNIDYIRFLKGRFLIALRDLANARKELNRIGLKSLLGYCDLHASYIFGAMNRLDDALKSIDSAIEGFMNSGFTFMLAYSYAERAILFAWMNLIDKAAMDVGEAIRHSANVQDRDVLGTVELARAIVYICKSNIAEGEISLERAAELLSHDKVALARVLAWKGVMLALQGEKKLAIQLLKEASGMFASMKCNRLAGQIEICTSKIGTGGWQDLFRPLI